MISLYIRNLFQGSEQSTLNFDQKIVMLFTDQTSDQTSSGVVGCNTLLLNTEEVEADQNQNVEYIDID